MDKQLIEMNEKTTAQTNLQMPEAQSDELSIYEIDEIFRNLPGEIVSEGTSIDITTVIKDHNFLQAVRVITDIEDGPIMSDDSRVTGLVRMFVLYKNIKSMEGIEYFTGLEMLVCSGNMLSILDLTHNTSLVNIDCSDNKLRCLDVSQNIALEELDCSVNILGSLDVSSNTALKVINCSDNQLSELYVRCNTALQRLDCENNKFIELDLRYNNNLNEFWRIDERVKIFEPMRF